MSRDPRRINLVSLLLAFAIGAAGYAIYQFGPHYLTEWKIKEALKEALSELYRASKQTGPRFEYIQPIERKVHERMRELGIFDPEAVVELNTSDPTLLIGRAAYTVVIEHPILHKTTLLHFTPEVTLDNHVVNWDKP